MSAAAALRAAGVPAETWLGAPGKLGNQLKYAGHRGIPFAVVIGPDEAAAGVAKVKDLTTGDQREIPITELAAALR
jgi:histidyl-tRNA synthetase